jgi:hypothetical protein
VGKIDWSAQVDSTIARGVLARNERHPPHRGWIELLDVDVARCATRSYSAAARYPEQLIGLNE